MHTEGSNTMSSPYCGEIAQNAINTLGSKCFWGRGSAAKSRKAEFIRYVYGIAVGAKGGFLRPQGWVQITSHQ